MSHRLTLCDAVVVISARLQVNDLFFSFLWSHWSVFIGIVEKQSTFAQTIATGKNRKITPN